MLRWRLPVGALLVALLALVLWSDGRVQGVPVAWWPGGSLPGGLVLAVFSILVIVPLLARELSTLLQAGGTAAWRWHATAMVAATAFAAVCLHAWRLGDWARLATLLAVLPLLVPLARALRGDAPGAVADLGRWFMAAVWIGAMPACWIALRGQVPWMTLVMAVLTVKSNDIGAYTAGMLAGRHRMLPWISPKKSWEGFAGGLVASTAMGVWLGTMAPTGPAWGAVYGVAVAVLGPLGDLAESVLKRQADAKDSGRTIPGMGGVFDVMDSLLPTAPAALWLLSGTAAA
jgi:phosphatidate cytidylyltransferase